MTTFKIDVEVEIAIDAGSQDDAWEVAKESLRGLSVNIGDIIDYQILRAEKMEFER